MKASAIKDILNTKYPDIRAAILSGRHVMDVMREFAGEGASPNSLRIAYRKMAVVLGDAPSARAKQRALMPTVSAAIDHLRALRQEAESSRARSIERTFLDDEHFVAELRETVPVVGVKRTLAALADIGVRITARRLREILPSDARRETADDPERAGRAEKAALPTAVAPVSRASPPGDFVRSPNQTSFD